MSQNDPTSADELLALARARFGDLTTAETLLFTATANGEPAEYGEGDPADAADWPPTRTIPADRLQWLCTDRRPGEHILPHAGVNIQGLRIDGALDLNDATLEFPLDIRNSSIPNGINARDARIRRLVLNGTHSGPIFADGIKLDADFSLRGNFISDGGIGLRGATIGGNLECSNAHFTKEGGEALNADGIKVDGSVFLSNVKAKGEIRLLDATIGGVLNCMRAHLANEGGDALSADRIAVNGSLFLQDNFTSDGGVRLLGATIGGNLSCSNAHFTKEGGEALNADGIKVDGSVFLSNVKAKGEVRLLDAVIGGIFDCTNGHFANEGGDALCADRIAVNGSVFLRGNFTSDGEVRLLGATIGGNLDSQGGQFANKPGDALCADGIKVDGSIYLKEVKAVGEVRLLGATIGRNLECDGGRFANEPGDALNAENITVNGSVFLRGGFHAHGRVIFVGASVDGFFQWRNVKSPENAHLILQSARVGTLWDDEKSWPDKLELDGFIYDRIYMDSPLDAARRIKWLRRKGDDRYLPQPYEQLARVLRAAGHERDAKRVLIAKQEDPDRLRVMSRWGRIRNEALGMFIGYGYQPVKALLPMIAIILYGWLWFWTGGNYDEFTVTTRIAQAPPFDSFIYSVDAFVPIVDLHQQRFRSPAAWQLRWYFYFHVAAGWTLTSLFVAGLSGLVRK